MTSGKCQTHSVQCPAVTTHFSLIMEPPQKCFVFVCPGEVYCSDAWYGAISIGIGVPPTIRPVDLPIFDVEI